MQLLNADCIEAMQAMQPGTVDMILADLPFGMTRNEWDTPLPLPEFWQAVHRVCKPGAAVVLFSQQPFTAALITSNPRQFRYEFVWIKNRSTGFLNAKKMPLRAHENILVFYDRLPTYNPQMAKGKAYRCKSGRASSNYGAQHPVITTCTGERYPTDVLHFDTVPTTGGAKAGHATQKPVDLCAWLIRTYTQQGQTVMDCCMGSGTTGVAAVQEEREFIGIELDAQTFAKAKTRIEAALAARGTL